MKITGIEESRGVYEGNPYDNIKFHCSEPFDEGKGFGARGEVVKVKRTVVVANLGKDLTGKELQALVGKNVDFAYDKFNNVKLVQVQP